jgi:hypothetical protein
VDDPAIKIDRPSDEPLFAHQFGKHAQRLERLRRASEKFLEEIDVEIELAERAEPGDRLPATDAAGYLPGVIRA